MNKIKDNLVLCIVTTLIVCSPLIIWPLMHINAQSNAPQTPGTNAYTYIAPPPPQVLAGNITLSGVGTGGSTLYCYYVFPKYPIGTVATNQGKCIQWNGTLSNSNYINVGFAQSPAFGAATGYDIIRLTNIQIMPATCTSCLRVSNGATSGLYQDKGAGSVGNYDISTTGISQVSFSAYLDNQNQGLPMLKYNSTMVNGQLTWYALPVDPPNTTSVTRIASTVNAGSTAVWGNTTAINSATLRDRQILGAGGGAILVATPTSGATYTTPTAVQLCAAMNSQRGATSNPQDGTGAGTAAFFYIFNQSGGANTIALAGGTGVTVTGTATVAQNHVREFMVVATSQPCSSVQIYSLMDSAF